MDLDQRKLLILITAGTSCLILLGAIIFGGGKKKSTLDHEPTGISIAGTTLVDVESPAELDTFIDVPLENDTIIETALNTTQPHGSNNGISSQPSISTLPQTTTTTTRVEPSATPGQSSSVVQTPSSAAPATMVNAQSPLVTQTRPSTSASTDTSSPSQTTALAEKTPPPRSPAVTAPSPPSPNSVTLQTPASSAHPSQSTQPDAKPPEQTETHAPDQPQIERQSPRPAIALKAPKAARNGVILQSKALITTKQFQSYLPEPRPGQPPRQSASTPPATSNSPNLNAQKPNVIAQITKSEADAFVQEVTRQWHKSGEIPSHQHVRLPKAAETTNTTIWRQEDVPKSPEEQRPIGIVLQEVSPPQPLQTTPASKTSPSKDRTRQGIPLRTDIPAGTSPLEKNGPDTPLWKRP